jgi:hypothetical protein
MELRFSTVISSSFLQKVPAMIYHEKKLNQFLELIDITEKRKITNIPM